MTDTLHHPFAAYPMVAEADATGRVAAVYADAANRLPFVPSLLKSLAVCPPYLVLAWQQIRPMLADPGFDAAATSVAEAARSGSPPDVSAAAARVLAPFGAPLARMLLLACGLHAALRDMVSADPAATDAPPTPDTPIPQGAPSQFDTDNPADLAVYGRIRASLDTPMINTVWRRLAAEGQLRATWPVLEQAAGRTRAIATRVQAEAYDTAVGLPWSSVAGPAALERAGVPDAAAGMRAILQAYITTLPRALALVADL